ncbi:GNAT family N-acetyltransferase [Robertmurraya korlensis]|uniref:GNAT family N-acetyltransferase n=1 Tax=Robertmurraya korlensis TaxID=519977 RepID=UPI0008245A90|nr:GNAT family N-acetyltransferase [Robertmurraya korlensis]
MKDEVNIRDLQSVIELEKVRELEALIWSLEDSIPVNQTVAAVKNGGFVLGAFLDEKLIGFQYSFPGFDGAKGYLCSHSLGIHPDYRTFGVGEKLKWAQKETALLKGYDLITWTYDPLETVNANLNLHKLGGVCSTYKKDVYGEMNDGLNTGLATDRFLIEWRLKSESVKTEFVRDAQHVIRTDQFNGNLAPMESNLSLSQDVLYVSVPGNFQTIKIEDFALAKKWRETTRKAFMHYFNKGYTATDLRKEKENHYYYVLQKL